MDEERKKLIQNIFDTDIIVQRNQHLKRWLKSENNNLSNHFLESLLQSEDTNEEITDRLNAIMDQQEREREQEEIEKQRPRPQVIQRKVYNSMDRLLFNEKQKQQKQQEEKQNRFEVNKRKRELENDLLTKKIGRTYIDTQPNNRPSSKGKNVSFNKMRKVKYIGGKKTRKSKKMSRKQSRRL
jgi:hypothetical protein